MNIGYISYLTNYVLCLFYLLGISIFLIYHKFWFMYFTYLPLLTLSHNYCNYFHWVFFPNFFCLSFNFVFSHVMWKFTFFMYLKLLIVFSTWGIQPSFVCTEMNAFCSGSQYAVWLVLKILSGSDHYRVS